ncbi:hypothetical protein BHM03_00052795 [Ensete ventricosum]|nr:hypothetical protein BHM03_00052795 [Ensete ventricosum]
MNGDLRYIREAGQSVFFVAGDELASAPKPRGTRTRGLRRRSPRHTAAPVEVMFVTAVARSATVILRTVVFVVWIEQPMEFRLNEQCVRWLRVWSTVKLKGRRRRRRRSQKPTSMSTHVVMTHIDDPTRRPTREEECKNDLASGTRHIDRCELRASSK